MKTTKIAKTTALFRQIGLLNRPIRAIELNQKERGHSKIDDLFRLSGKRDSNPRPSAWEADALPTELLPLVLWR
jgi:hypothetical protein